MKCGFAVFFYTAKSRAAFFILHIFIFSFFIFLVACGGPQATRTAGGEGAVFDISSESLHRRADTAVNIGKVRAGEIVQYDAWLRNTGEVPLVIINVETSCGCTSVEYEHKPIPAGEKGKFSFRFDSRGMRGVQIKAIEIRTSAGPQVYQLFVQAEVTGDDLL